MSFHRLHSQGKTQLFCLVIALLLASACRGSAAPTNTIPATEVAAATATIRAAATATPAPTAELPTPTSVPARTAAAVTETATATPGPVPTATREPSTPTAVSLPLIENAEDLRITIVFDNTAFDPRLKAEWGFAALIEYGEDVLLFDTGANASTLLGNMALLGIDPTRIEAVVLSHTHDDHTAGLSGLYELAIRPTVFVLPSFPQQFKNRVAARTDLVEVTPGMPVAEGVFSTGEIASVPDTGQPSVIAEQALVIKTPEGIVVVTGCAHPGIVEMVAQAQDRFGGPVRLVVGGFHLLHEDADAIDRILAAFRELGVEQVAPTHCTGEQAIAMFADEYGDDYVKAGAGRVIVVPSQTQVTEQETPGESAKEMPDYWPTEGWRTSIPEEQGMRSEMLAQMLTVIQDNHYDIDGVLVVRNGYVVLDSYVYPFAPESKHFVRSCTKSVVSALIGIAIEQGYIDDVQQSLLTLFPNRTIANVDANKEAMTLEHVLTMATGLECRDSYLYDWLGLEEMVETEDWVQHMLDLPMAEPPGSRFEYCNGASFLLSALIQEKTGKSALAFAEEHLFGPLGITDVEWSSSPQGISIGWSQLQMRLHDMAKFGYLYLNEGVWDGRQVVPAAWVEESTRKHIDATLEDGYGYQWWVDGPDLYLALGYGSQFIFVVPDKDLVVAVVSDLPERQFYVPQDLLNEYIIPAAVSTEPLPPDPEWVALLESLVQDLAGP